MAKNDMTMWSAVILLVIGLVWLLQEFGTISLVSNGVWLPLIAVLYGLKKLIYK